MRRLQILLFALACALCARTSHAADPLGAATEPSFYSNSYALVIGIDKYSNGWPKLANAVRDAEEVGKVLSNEGFRVTSVIDPDFKALEEALTAFVYGPGTDPEARVVIWFAGHGYTLDGEGYIVPRDAPHPSVGSAFRRSAFNLRRFGEYMREIKSKHAIAVFDSCFGGSVFRSERGVPSAVLTIAAATPVRYFISSGAENQEVSDDGTFRKLFVQALTGEAPEADANKDGYVTGSELGLFLYAATTNYSHGSQTPRHGPLREFGMDRGDVIFKVGGQKVAQLPLPSANAKRSEGDERLRTATEEFLSSSPIASALPQPAGSRTNFVSGVRDPDFSDRYVAVTQQSIDGTPVLGAVSKLTVTSDLGVTQYIGSTSLCRMQGLSPSLDETRAADAAHAALTQVLASRKARNIDDGVILPKSASAAGARLFVLDPAVLKLPGKRECALTWQIRFENLTALVDATNGDLIYVYGNASRPANSIDRLLDEALDRVFEASPADLFASGEPGAVRQAFRQFFTGAVRLTGPSRGSRPISQALDVSWTMDPARPRSAGNAGRPDKLSKLVTRSQPICDASADYWSDCADLNSGILLKAMLLAADGGSFEGSEVAGIGVDKMFRIASRTLLINLAQAPRLIDAADGLRQSCEELAEASIGDVKDTDCKQVFSAMKAVGLTY